jgi:hypothetical protein
LKKKPVYYIIKASQGQSRTLHFLDISFMSTTYSTTNKAIKGFSWLFIFLTAFIVTTAFVYAQAFKPPLKSAPHNFTLGELGDLSGYLQLTPDPEIAYQPMQSPLTIDSSLDPAGYGVISASASINDAAVIGSAGSDIDNVPSIVSVFGAGASVATYGYAAGAPVNYGFAGLADGVGSVGVVGEVGDAAGYAGQFIGKLKIEEDTVTTAGGRLTTDGDIFSGRTEAAVDIDVATAHAITAIGGVTADAPLKKGIRGISGGFGVYGRSDWGTGFSGQVTGASAANSRSIYGVTSSPDGYGVYGLTEEGNGVVGVVDSVSGYAAVYGETTGSGSGSAGVYGKSSAWSGLFDGHFKIVSGHLSIGGTVLTADMLEKLMAWCWLQGQPGDTYCVQDYCASETYNPDGTCA